MNGSMATGPSLAGAPNATSKPSQVETAVITLGLNIERLNVVFGRLDDKLQPVLRSKNVPEGDGSGDTEEKVGLARVVGEHAFNIERLANAVEGIINRLEL